MSFEQIPRRKVRELVADQIDDLVLLDTATAGGAATITVPDATHDDNSLKDLWGYINDGTSEGDEFLVSSNIASTKVVTADRNFSSTPDTTSILEIHSRFKVPRYNKAIDDAIRRWGRQFPVATVSAEIVANCALLNPTFRDWANGGSTNPDSWVTSSEYVQQATTNPSLVAGAGEFGYRARVWSNSTLVILEVDDGTTQDTKAHDGLGYNLLSVAHTPAVGASAITIKIGHSGASAVSSIARSTTSIRGDYSMQITWADGVVAIVDSAYAPTGYTEYRYGLPSLFRVLTAVEYAPAEAAFGNLGARNRLQEMPRHAFTGGIDGQDPAKYVQFDPEVYVPDDDTFLKVVGMASSPIPTDDDSVIAAPISLIVDWASYQLLRPSQDGDRFHRDALETALVTRVAYPTNAHIFDPV